MTELTDVQNQHDPREISIDQVGVCDLVYPIVVLDKSCDKQNTVATMSISVDLPHNFKGTHMSRFIEVLEAHRGEVTMSTMPNIVEHLRERLDAERSRIEVRFPYFIEKSAPATGSKALLDIKCWFIGTADGNGHDFILGVTTPVTSLCPCSKEISDYGAHNQRSFLTIELRTHKDAQGQDQMIWIEDVVAMAEACASAPVYPLLKRPDERHVTMQAFDKPVFVEDMVRQAAMMLNQDDRVAWYKVRAVNHESIHNHNAFAQIERDLVGDYS